VSLQPRHPQKKRRPEKEFDHRNDKMEFDYTSTARPQKYDSSEPMSIKDITSQATKFDYNQLIPLRSWLRTAESMHKQVGSSQIALRTSLLHWRAETDRTVLRSRRSISRKATNNRHTSCSCAGQSRFPVPNRPIPPQCQC